MEHFVILPPRTIHITFSTNKNELKIIKRLEQTQKVDACKHIITGIMFRKSYATENFIQHRAGRNTDSSLTEFETVNCTQTPFFSISKILKP